MICGQILAGAGVHFFCTILRIDPVKFVRNDPPFMLFLQHFQLCRERFYCFGVGILARLFSFIVKPLPRYSNFFQNCTFIRIISCTDGCRSFEHHVFQKVRRPGFSADFIDSTCSLANIHGNGRT